MTVFKDALKDYIGNQRCLNGTSLDQVYDMIDKFFADNQRLLMNESLQALRNHMMKEAKDVE